MEESLKNYLTLLLLAIIWGSSFIWGVFDAENITAYHLIGMFIILSGVYLVNKKAQRK